MSKTIDERVVEMRFDNENFESNAKTSLGTLERLKQALSFKTSTDEIDKLAQSVGNVDMDGLGGAVESVKNKFSALEVIAVTALMNITNKAINAGEALVKSLTLDQIGAGWDKYAQKTTAVQTIMSATANQFTDTAEQMQYVNEQLDKLNAFTDETSYNFVDMVGNIGKFTANNIKLDTAVTSMQGIATWAAISGQNANTASRAMYQLSQAMGGGVIRLQDWMSIEQANMATAEFKTTAMETAVSLGKLTKSADGTYKTLEGNTVTIENFRNTLQDLWFTSDVLTASLDKYGKFSDVVLNMADETGLTVTDLIGLTSDLKEGTLDMDKWMEDTGKTAEELQGYLDILGDEELDLGFRAMRAAQEAKTFEEAIGSVKDAVSTGWMNTFEIIFGDYEHAKELFTGLANELYDVFAEGGNARNELLEEAFGEQETAWDGIMNKIDAAGLSTEDFQNKVIETAREHGVAIDQMIEDEKGFENTLKNGWLNGDILKESLTSFTEGLDDVSMSSKSAEDQLKDLGDIVNRVLDGEFGNGKARVDALTAAGHDYATVQAAVNKVLKGQELTIDDLSEAEMQSLGYTEDQIAALQELKDTAGMTKEEIQALADEISQGDKKSGRTLLFESVSNIWESLKTILHEVKQAWEDVFPPTTADQLYRNLEAVNKFSESLLNLSKKVAPVVGRAFKTVFLIIDTFLSAARQVASFIGGVFSTAIGLVNFKMDDFGSSIVDAVQGFHDWVEEAVPVKKALEGIGKAIAGVILYISNLPVVSNAIKKTQEAFKYFFEQVSKGGEGFLNIFNKTKDFITTKFPRLTKFVTDFVETFTNLPIVRKGISKVQELFSKLFEKLSKGFPGVLEIFQEIGTFVSEKFSKITTFIGELVEKFMNIPGVREGIEKVQEVFGYLFDKVSQGAPGMMQIIDDIAKVISDKFPNLTKIIGDFIDRLKGMDELSFGGVLDAVNILREDLFSLLTEGIGKGTTFQKTWAKIKTAAKDALDTFNKNIPKFNSGTILSVGLASSLIATILKFGDLAKAIKTPFALVNNLFGSITGAFKNLGAVLKGIALIPMAIGIGMIATAIAKLAELPAGNIIAAGAAIGVVTAAIAGLVYAIGGGKSGKGGLKSFKQIGMALVEIGIAMAAVGAALYVVSNMKLEDVAPKLEILAVVIVAMLGITFALSKIAPKLEASTSAALAMVAFAASVWILVQSLKDLANSIGDSQSLDMATQSLFNIILSFGAAMALIAKFGGKNLAGGAVSMLVMVGAIKLLVMVLEDIKDFDPNIVYDNLEGYALIFGGLLVLAGIARLAGKSLGISMLGMIASVVLMGVALNMMSGFKIENAAGALTGFAGIVLGMAVILSAVSKIVEANGEGKDNKFMQLGVMMLEFSAAIVILGAAVALMGMLPLAAVIQGGLVVAALMVLMAGLVFVTKYAQDVQKTIIALAIVIGILVAAVGIFAFLPEDAQAKVWEGVAAVGALMAMLAVLIIVTKLAEGSVAGMAMVLAVVVVVGAVVYLLSTFADVEKVAVIADSLSKIFATLAILMIAITIAGAASAVAIVGIVEMMAVIALILMLVTILNEFNGTENTLLTAMNKTLPLFEAIGKMIGKVFGGIAEGWSEGVANAMTNLTEGLKSLAEGLGQLNEAVDPEMIDAVSNLIAAVTLLTADDFLSGIKKLFGGGDPLGNLGAALEELGPDVAAFAEQTKSVVPSKLNGIAKVLDSIVSVGEKFKSSENVERMGETLEKFGPQFKKFNDNLKDIDPENVRAMAQSLKVFAESATQVQQSASTANGMDFSSMFQQLGMDVPEGFSIGVTEGMPISDEAMNQLFGQLQNQATTGSLDLTNLAQFTGGQFPTDFATSLMSNSGVATGSVDQLMGSLSQYMSPEVMQQLGLNAGTATAQGYSEGVNAGISYTDEAAQTLQNNVKQRLMTDNQSYFDSGKLGVDEYLRPFNESAESGLVAGGAIANNTVYGIDPQVPSFFEKGTACADEFIKAFNEKHTDAESAGKELARNAAAGAGSLEESFYTAGANAGQGFINGLNSKVDAAGLAGASLGRAAYQAAMAALDENSPSKVLYRIGDYGGIGFVRGLLDEVGNAYKAGDRLGNSSVDAVVNAVSAISSYVDDHLDANPTITPILDLSQVRAASTELASMLNESVAATRPNMAVAAYPVRRVRSFYPDDLQNEDGSRKSGNVYTFNQYNNSPKALSRTEIYRSTKNQFSQFKEAVSKS